MAQGNWVRKPTNDLTVIFVHGFNSSEECWLNSNKVYWPELLKSENDFLSVGIYVFSYRTNISSGYYSLGDVVDSLKEYLELDKVINFSKVIFICHSMGGIVARRFLVKQKMNLMSCGLKEVGLFLVASPSLGSDYANMLSPIAKLTGHTQADALKFSQENIWLNDLDKDFIDLKEGGLLKIKGKELIEDRPIILKNWLFKKQIVEPFSGAKYFKDSFKVPDSDHFTIARPESSESIQHRLLCNFIGNLKSNEDIQEINTSIPFTPPEKQFHVVLDSKDIFLDISVMAQENESSYSDDLTLEYQIEKEDALMSIRRSMGYLLKFYSGGPIKPIRYNWTPFDWDFPNLDFKVLNSSNQTIFITEVVFEIEESKLDPFPVLIVEPDSYRNNALHFLLKNEGWGEVKDLKICFHLLPLERDNIELNFTKPYPYEVMVGNFLDNFNVDITESFCEAGVDLNGLRSSVDHMGMFCNKTKSFTWLGPFQACGAFVSGELIFQGRNIQGLVEEQTVQFSTIVWLVNQDLVGIPVPPTYQYGTKFQVEGEKYKRHVSISHALNPGEVDRFNIKIGIDKSSLHRFKVRVLCNTDVQIISSSIEMLTFVPRSGIALLQKQ
jgi:hypothetical protein